MPVTERDMKRRRLRENFELTELDVNRARLRLKYEIGFFESWNGRAVYFWYPGPPSSYYCTRARGTEPAPAGGHVHQDEVEAGGRGLAGAPTAISHAEEAPPCPTAGQRRNL